MVGLLNTYLPLTVIVFVINVKWFTVRLLGPFLRQGPELIRNRTNTAEEHTAAFLQSEKILGTGLIGHGAGWVLKVCLRPQAICQRPRAPRRDHIVASVGAGAIIEPCCCGVPRRRGLWRGGELAVCLVGLRGHEQCVACHRYCAAVHHRAAELQACVNSHGAQKLWLHVSVTPPVGPFMAAKGSCLSQESPRPVRDGS